MWKKLFVQEGELYYRRREGEPVRAIAGRGARAQLLAQCHDGMGHFGRTTTRELVAEVAWWPGMAQEVAKYVDTCEVCQQYRAQQGKLQKIQMPIGQIFERVAMDFVGPLPVTESGNRYILVAVEAVTRWPMA